MRSHLYEDRHDAWNTDEPYETLADQALVVIVVGAVMALLVALVLATPLDVERDVAPDPAVLVPATGAPAVPFEEGS